MTMSERMKGWQAAAARARRAVVTLRERWERDGRSPRPGDLIEANLADGARLIALERHPRHPAIVRVAVADGRLDAGRTDVVIGPSLHPDALVVRTALTRWVPASGLRAPHESCDARVVEAVLAAEAAGAAEGPDAAAVDDDDEHRAHVQALRRSLLRLPVAIVAAPRVARDAAPLAAASRAMPLAAQSISTQMLQALRPAADRHARQPVPWGAAGALTAVSADDGAELLFEPAEGAPAPPAVRVVGEGGGVVELAWVSSPDGAVFASVPRQPWRDGVVRFQVGADPALEVTVAR